MSKNRAVEPRLTGELMMDLEKEREALEFKYRKEILARVINYIVYKYIPDDNTCRLNKDHNDAIVILEWRMEYIHHHVQGF